MFVRPLIAILIVLFALSASGITSAIAATVTEDDCCADGAEQSQKDDGPTEGHEKCPPLCHACACSPTFAVPGLAIPEAFVAIAQPVLTSVPCSQLPASPPGRGVFHPPRCTA